MSNRDKQHAARIQQMINNPNYFREAQERARRQVLEERRQQGHRRTS